jgi:hypothetical protein
MKINENELFNLSLIGCLKRKAAISKNFPTDGVDVVFKE